MIREMRCQALEWRRKVTSLVISRARSQNTVEMIAMTERLIAFLTFAQNFPLSVSRNTFENDYGSN